MRVPVRLAALAGLAAGLCGCAYPEPAPYAYAPGAYPYGYDNSPYDPGRRTATGALVGAGAGAALGGLAGGGRGAAIGAAAGGALGAVAGASNGPEEEAPPPDYDGYGYYGHGY